MIFIEYVYLTITQTSKNDPYSTSFSILSIDIEDISHIYSGDKIFANHSNCVSTIRVVLKNGKEFPVLGTYRTVSNRISYAISRLNKDQLKHFIPSHSNKVSYGNSIEIMEDPILRPSIKVFNRPKHLIADDIFITEDEIIALKELLS